MSTGKQMPCDPKEQVLITKDGEVVRGFVPHWATCPYAQEFRKPNPKLADVAQEAIDRIERKGQVDGE